jgi:hypothetical protein
MRLLATKKRTMSKMNAMNATAAANPEMRELQHVMDISRTWARRPKTAEAAERIRATMCKKRT